jgi:hypothetical protein
VSEPDDAVWRVDKAFRSAVGDRAKSLMHRRRKRLANLTPLEIAREPQGARIVKAELENIIRQAHHTGLRRARRL